MSFSFSSGTLLMISLACDTLLMSTRFMQRSSKSNLSKNPNLTMQVAASTNLADSKY